MWLLILMFAVVCLIDGQSVSIASADEAEKGKLDRVEDEATKPAKEGDRSGKKPDTDDGDPVQEPEEMDEETRHMFLILAQAILLTPVYGGYESWVRTAGADSAMSAELPRRKAGEPLIPYLTGETSWQEAGADISALSLKAEAGFGPVAIQYRLTRYSEERPADALEIRQVYGLYRMSFFRHVEIDAGAGRMTLAGNRRTSGFSLTSPIMIYPLKHLGLEVRPAWAWINGNPITDTTYLVVGRFSYFTAKGGYRRVAVPGVALDGPLISVGFNL